MADILSWSPNNKGVYKVLSIIERRKMVEYKPITEQAINGIFDLKTFSSEIDGKETTLSFELERLSGNEDEWKKVINQKRLESAREKLRRVVER